MYKNLAQKWRPAIFGDVIGQDIIITVLKNSIKFDKIAPAYLFNGPVGTGKTSVARIFARALNCSHTVNGEPCMECDSCKSSLLLNNTDIIEIDGASWRKIDDVRAISASLNYPPIGKRKVIIIDEIHMLTIQAFNAILKTIEEPPSYVTFIFATTDFDKVLPTIVSRCQQFEFKKIPFQLISDNLEHICEEEKIKYEKSALNEVAEFAEGSMRNAETALEKLLFYSKAAYSEDIPIALGVSTGKEIDNYLKLIEEQNIKELELLLNTLAEKNYDPYNFTKRAVSRAQDMVVRGKSANFWFNVSDLLIAGMINSRAVAEPMLLLRNATFKAASLEKIEDVASFIEKIKRNFGNIDFRHIEKIVPEQDPVNAEDNAFDQNKQSKVNHSETDNETVIWNKLLDKFEEGSTKSILINNLRLEHKDGQWRLRHTGGSFSLERIKKEFDNINKLFYEITSSTIDSITKDDEHKQTKRLEGNKPEIEKENQSDNGRIVDLLKKRYNATIVGSQSVEHA